jgi:CHAT domain-containing protein
MEFAAGLCRAEIAAQVLQHVAECGYCAPLLRIYLEDLPIPATEPISGQAGSSLASKAADNEEKVLRPIRLASDSSTSRRSSLFASFFKHRFVWAGGGLALAVAILVAGPLALNHYDLRRAQTLAAATFAERRTTEMRFSWAPYSEWGLTRGEKPSSGALSDRPNLVAAVGLANEHQDSSDPRWARANGRVYLLAGELQKASEFLKRSTEKGLDDPSTEIDLAVAYFQSAQQDQKLSNPEGKPIPPNLEESIELLNKAASSPKATKNERAAALFDLAIAYQKMLRRDMAAQTWEEYLKLESTGPWAEEARQRLEDAKKKISPPRTQGYRMPGYFLHHSTDPDTQKSTEEYQDVALRSWLSDAMANKDADALPALQRLASLLQEHHGDTWLHDFLQARKSGDLSAISALSQALNSNRRGFSNDAALAAETAASRFLRAGNRPGILMARFENLYAQHRALQQHACLKQARALEQDLLHTSYKWLQTQVALAEMLCYALGTSFDSAEKQLKIARQIADAARFHVLSLRVRAFEADLKLVRGGCAQSWATIAEGLEQYWQGPALPGRLYEFYNRVEGCLITHQFWHAARSLQERQIAILERESDPADRSASVEASVHTAMARIFEELHEAKLARGEAVIVTERRKQASQDYDKYELFIRLERAESQVQTGDARGALYTLKQAQATFLNTDDDLIHLSFYRLLGDSYLAMKDLDQAEDAYQTSLQIAENGAGNIKEPGKRRQWINETGGVYRRIVGVLLDRKKYREALQFWEWYQNRSAFVEADLATEAGIGSWSRIEKEVLSQPLPSPMSETRLVFAAIKDNIHVWVINKNGIATLWIPVKPVDLAGSISEFSERCSNRYSSLTELEQESRKLFNLLLQPVMAQVGDSSMMVVELDHSMHGLLLEALKSPEGWYFGQKYSTVYSPGFLKELELRRSGEPIPESGLLVDASASAGGSYPSLDRTEREALVRLFPRLEILDGAQATPQKLSRMLAESQMFVFIGHGIRDGLILNSGWVLKPEDFAPKSLRHLQLTVLSACSTASSRSGPLDTNGLVSTFLDGGVSTVVASHWEVDDYNTSQFMESFYTSLKNGKTAAQSMRDARQEVFQTHSHPYFWAAFSLSGRSS